MMANACNLRICLFCAVFASTATGCSSDSSGEVAGTGGVVTGGGGVGTSGGVTASGGNVTTGGGTVTGGAAAGGMTTAGGVLATGGTWAAGGMSATGGSSATGGVSAAGGNAATGGNLSGGGDPGSLTLEGALLDPANYQHHADTFSANEEEETVVKAIPNSEAWGWMVENIPFFECSASKIEEIYYFRWWSFRKHIINPDDYSGWVLTEFNNYTHANSSAFGHHVAEGRWMRDKTVFDQYTLYWYRGGGNLHKYSQWSTDALYKRYLVNLDEAFIVDLLDELISDFADWKSSHMTSSGLFWSYDVRDAMEESISGSREEQNRRPTKNSYMAGNAKALAEIATLAGRADVAAEYQAVYDSLRQLIIDRLWDPEAQFFKVLHENDELDDAREVIGFIPWMFDIPGPEHEDAWLQIRDEEGFLAPKGLTTAERRHPEFRSNRPQGGSCEWDGAVWPFATSQTLNALARLLRSPGPHPVDRGDYYQQLLTYASSHDREGIPHIGEYHDEVTGRWLRDEYPRSWFYNHSTFVDLVINGLVGLVPRGDDVVEVDPLVPAGPVSWFALDRVLYHNHELTILWDEDGSRYGHGAGLRVYADGRLIAQSPTLAPVTGSLSP